MKKRLLVLGLAFTMFAATACGTSSDDGNKTSKADKTVTATPNSDKTSETQKNDDKNDDAKESYKSADDITMDDLKNHEETPAEDFKYRDKSNGEAVIKEYTGDDPIVVIPNEIDGKKVVDIGRMFANNKDVATSLNLKPNQMFLVNKYKMQTQKFSEQELRKIIQQLEDLDYQYKIGLIDLNIGLDAIICAI